MLRLLVFSHIAIITTTIIIYSSTIVLYMYAKAIGISPYAFLLPPPILLRLSSSSPNSNLLPISIHHQNRDRDPLPLFALHKVHAHPISSTAIASLDLEVAYKFLPSLLFSRGASIFVGRDAATINPSSNYWVGNPTFQLHGGSSRRSCLNSQFLSISVLNFLFEISQLPSIWFRLRKIDCQSCLRHFWHPGAFK
jgi:hypothetical protein